MKDRDRNGVITVTFQTFEGSNVSLGRQAWGHGRRHGVHPRVHLKGRDETFIVFSVVFLGSRIPNIVPSVPRSAVLGVPVSAVLGVPGFAVLGVPGHVVVDVPCSTAILGVPPAIVRSAIVGSSSVTVGFALPHQEIVYIARQVR